MSKIIVPVLIGVALIGAAVLSGGITIGPSLAAVGSSAALAAGTVATTTLVASGIAITAAGGILGSIGTALLIAGASSILQGVVGALKGAPRVGSSQLSRLNPSLIPATPRTMVFGRTAMSTDIRYVEPSGTDQEYVDYIIAVASHAVTSIEEIWFEDRQAWEVSGGVNSFYTGYLTIDIRLEGTAANAITVASGARWTASNCRLTGCAYIHIRVKRTGNDKKANSPLASGLPGRVTIIGKGAKVYDPRRDTTVGGSGAHRSNDQTTWEYANGGVDLGNNPALQALWYLLGWKINGKLVVGKGIPASRIDIASFIAAANLCDEAVTLAAGGTQRRYETHGVFSEADAPLTVLDTICTNCNAGMTDVSGKLGIEVAYNDLTGAIPVFTEDDILGEFAYDPSPSLHETANVIRGRYTDPSTNALYQLKDYPEILLTSVDGIERSAPLDLAMVQDGNRAQRLAKQMLQRAQYAGVFTASFGIRALMVKRGSVIKLTFGPLGFTNKLFRVQQQTIVAGSGEVAMILREENVAIYAWAADERAVVTAAAPVLFDPRNDPRFILDGSDIGVDNNATHGINQQDNAALAVDTTGWALGFGARATAVSGAPTQYVIQTTASSGSQIDLPRTSIIGGSRLFIQVWVYRSAGLTALNLAANTYDAVSGTGIGPLGGALSVVPTAAGGSGQLFTITGAAPMNAGTIQLSFYGLSGNAGTVQIGAPVISYSQIGADSTASNTPSLSVPPTLSVAANSAGVINSGELPITLQGIRRKGSTDVSSSTAWSLVTVGCVATVDSAGLATVTAVSSSSGSITWTSVGDGVTLTQVTAVSKINASAPVTSGGGGGGGAPGGAASDTAITPTSSTSYGTANSIILSVIAGSSGQVNLTAPLDFQCSATGGSAANSCRGKWQWRVAGGTFADVTTEILASTVYDRVNAWSGHIDVNMNKTGLASGSTYEFQLYMRKEAGLGTISFRNAATATPV